VIHRVFTIAWNTGREAIRSKLLYTLFFFALVLIFASLILANISYVERNRILQDIGMASIRFFSVAIAIFVGVGLIHREVERRTVYTILSKPLTRGEFLLGKYVGLVGTLWLQAATMSAVFAAISLLRGVALDGGHAAAFGLLGVELAVVVAIATLFSAFTTPLLASLFAGGLWVAGNLTRNLRDMGAESDVEIVRQVTELLHRVLPDLASFNLSIEAAHGLPVAASDVWLPAIYGAAYTAIVLVCAVSIFERRDFK
jgi:ABC-type transport system involved in multi-copper enzyme maturation permease subunit